MNRLLSLAALVALAACESPPTAPTLAPVGAEADVYTPVFPNAPLCPAGTTQTLASWQGVKLPRVHSYFTHNPPAATLVNGQSNEQRKFHLEGYSPYFGDICRNTWLSAGWQVQDVGTAFVDVQQYDGPVRVILTAFASGTADRVVGTQASKSDTVMVSATGY